MSSAARAARRRLLAACREPINGSLCLFLSVSQSAREKASLRSDEPLQAVLLKLKPELESELESECGSELERTRRASRAKDVIQCIFMQPASPRKPRPQSAIDRHSLISAPLARARCRAVCPLRRHLPSREAPESGRCCETLVGQWRLCRPSRSYQIEILAAHA